MTQIRRNHYKEFFFKLTLFLLTILAYIPNTMFYNLSFQTTIYMIMWVTAICEMLQRLFPKKIASAGTQKIFEKNFIKTDIKNIKKDYKSAIIITIFWIIWNAFFFCLYFFKIINVGILLILSMFYTVADLICILFFCPFQRWIIKNKCCNTCRIYNWDYFMRFTPLIIIPNFFNYSLVLLSLIILIIWEYTYNKYPERFYEETNGFLKCQNCKELMCKNKIRKVEQK